MATLTEEQKQFILDNYRTMSVKEMLPLLHTYWKVVLDAIKELGIYEEYRNICRARVSSGLRNPKNFDQISVHGGKRKWNQFNSLSPTAIYRTFNKMQKNGYQLNFEKKICFITKKTFRFLYPEKKIVQKLGWRIRDLRDPNNPRDIIH